MDLPAIDEPRQVAEVLANAYGLTVRRLHPGPVGTSTRNFLVDVGSGWAWFAKTYPMAGRAELEPERAAVALAAFAADAGVPVPSVLPTEAGELLHAAPGPAMSVWHYVDAADSAEGGLFGARWDAVGQVVGRLHRCLARHPAATPVRLPGDRLRDLADDERRLQALAAAYASWPAANGFTTWARQAIEERLAWWPTLSRLLDGVPPLTIQVVHGGLAAPNLLLSGDRVAGIIDFRPPTPRPAVWELARIGCDPRTVLARDDWPQGLARLVGAYHDAYPVLPAVELAASVRVAVIYTAASAYPLSEPVGNPGAVTPMLESYARDRHHAAHLMIQRLAQAEEMLRASVRSK